MRPRRKEDAPRLPRDSRGWRVPMLGTKSRVVYELLIRGLGSRKIIAETGYEPRTVRVLVWKIRNPGLANAMNIPKVQRG